MEEIKQDVKSAETTEETAASRGKKKTYNAFSNQKLKDRLFVISLIFLPLLQFAIFWGYVNFDSFLMAFESPIQAGFNLKNWYRFKLEWTSTNSIQIALKNTGIFFIISNFVNMPMVLFCSFFLFRKVYGYKAFRVIFYLPNIISGAVMAMMFKYLCLGDGPIVQFAQFLGIRIPDIVISNGLLNNEVTGFNTIMFYAVWSGFGINMILYLGAMMRIPEEVLESAKIDGIGLFGEFFRMVVPMIWPTVTTMIVLNLTGLFTWFGPIMILTGGWNNTSTVGWYIFRNIIEYTSNYGLYYPAFVGLMCTVISIPLVFGVRFILDKITEAVEY